MGNSQSSSNVFEGEQPGAGAVQQGGETPLAQPANPMNNDAYTLDFLADTHYKNFSFDTKSEEFHAMLKISAPLHEQQDRPGIDVVCVLDVSGSMRGSKISLLRKSMRRLVRNLGSKDRVAFITFDTRVKTLMNFTVMTNDGKETARALVKRLQPGSSTNLSGGLNTGISLLASEMRNEVTSVLLFTDGQANMGTTSVHGILAESLTAAGMGKIDTTNVRDWTTQQVQEWLTAKGLHMYAQSFRQNNVDGMMLFSDLTREMLTDDLGVKTLHLAKFERELHVLRTKTSSQGEAGPEKHIQVNTFGFGHNHNTELLEGIANQFDGMYFYMENEDAIVAGFANCLGGMLSTVAQDIEVVLRPNTDVEAFTVHKDDNVTQNGDGSTTVHFGDLQSEEERHILVSCTLPALHEADSDFELFTADVRFKNLVTELDETRQVLCTLDRNGVEGEIDLDVDEARNRHIALKAMEEAEALGEANDFTNARLVIDRCQEFIDKSPSAAMSFSRNVCDDLLVAKEKMADRQTWNTQGKQYYSQNIMCHKTERACNFDVKYKSQDCYNNVSKYATLDLFNEEDSDDSVEDDFLPGLYSSRPQMNQSSNAPQLGCQDDLLSFDCPQRNQLQAPNVFTPVSNSIHDDLLINFNNAPSTLLDDFDSDDSDMS